MLSSFYLLWLAARWVTLGIVKGSAMLLLWTMSPQQALECFEEMEQRSVHEQH